MARHTSADNFSKTKSGSPRGFWPDPSMESFFKEKSPPWEVPSRRKTRGHKQRSYYFDFMKEDILFTRGGEVTTKNAFELLEDTSEIVEQEPPRKKIEESSSEGEYLDTCVWHDSENTLHATYEDFMFKRSNSLNFNIDFMYNNKYNFCSGYFPDFITLDDNLLCDMSDKNIYPIYYIYTNNRKYLKQ